MKDSHLRGSVIRNDRQRCVDDYCIGIVLYCVFLYAASFAVTAVFRAGTFPSFLYLSEWLL